MGELLRAVESNDKASVRRLLDGGTDVNATDLFRNTPLHYACFLKALDIVQLLLAGGAAVNAANMWDETPLHIACMEKALNIARLLLEHGANLAAKDDDGDTPLFLVKDAALREKLYTHARAYRRTVLAHALVMAVAEKHLSDTVLLPELVYSVVFS